MGRVAPNLNKRGVYATASAAFASGAAPKTINGKTITSDYVGSGLSARCTVSARTNTTTISAKWQVSNDNSTWLDVKTANAAANVALVTGTGSDVAADVVIDAPAACLGWKYCRIQCYTAVSTADGTNDVAATSYNYRETSGF